MEEYYLTEEEIKEVIEKRKNKMKFIINELVNGVDIFNTDGMHFNIKFLEEDLILYTINVQYFCLEKKQIIKEKKTYISYNYYNYSLQQDYLSSQIELYEIIEKLYNKLKLNKEIKEELNKVENNTTVKKVKIWIK